MKISSEFELKGPFKIIKKTKEVREVKNPDISSVTLFTKLNNKTIKIRENNLKIKVNGNGNECVIYIYHLFDDINFNGRWYNQNFPIKLLYNIQKNKNKLIVKFSKNWEDFNTKELTSATITITLSDKAIDKIIKELQKCE
jgi:hypothetical protein